MRSTRIFFLSMTITLLISFFLYYAYVAIDNTQFIMSGSHLSPFTVSKDDGSFSVDIFGNKYTLRLSEVNNALKQLQKYEYLVPRAAIAVLQLNKLAREWIENVKSFFIPVPKSNSNKILAFNPE